MSENQSNSSTCTRPWLAADSNRQSTTQSLCILDLPDVLIKACLSFVGPGYHRFVAGTCHAFREQYPFPKKTTWENAGASVSCAQFCLNDNLNKSRPMRKTRFLDMLHTGAAGKGQVSVLQWARMDHGYVSREKHFLFAAVRRGHVNVLEWAYEKDMNCIQPHLFTDAAYYGHVHILHWIHKRRFADREDAEYAARFAARHGHVSVLQWLKDQSLLNVKSEYVWTEAAGQGHIDVLQWLYDNGYTESQNVINEAARKGRIVVLEWGRDHGLQLTARACSSAASYGHLDVLQWLQENGCPWDCTTIFSARINGHHSIVQWARDNGCPEPPG